MASSSEVSRHNIINESNVSICSRSHFVLNLNRDRLEFPSVSMEHYQVILESFTMQFATYMRCFEMEF